MTKTEAYKFLQDLVGRHPQDDAVGLLKDILVNYFMCPSELGKGDDFLSPSIEKEVCELMKQNLKINAIKLVRDHSLCGLKEAKDYVEGRIWESTCGEVIVERIRKDYHLG